MDEPIGIGLAGVLALSEGLKSNHVMRCLDLDVRPGDEELARCVFRFTLD
jgi:protein phosphatase 1 regulatory subunit 37